MLDTCPCVDYEFISSKTKSSLWYKSLTGLNPQVEDEYEDEKEHTPSNETGIERGDDELAFWLKQARPGSDHSVIIAFDIQTNHCPVCHGSVKIFGLRTKKTDKWGRHTDFVKLKDGFKQLLDHIRAIHSDYDTETNKPYYKRWKSDEDLEDKSLIFDRFYTDYEIAILNKTIAMLQVLIKYEVSTAKSVSQYRKRAECLYRLGKEFLLTDAQIMELVDMPHGSRNRMPRLMALGLDEFYGGEKNYPAWMQRVLKATNK
jgi:hypothetical protein